MIPSAHLVSIATAVPAHILEQRRRQGGSCRRGRARGGRGRYGGDDLIDRHCDPQSRGEGCTSPRLRSDVDRVPVFGLGCAGGVSGVAIAACLAHARARSVVLLVAMEVCTLSFRLDELCTCAGTRRRNQTVETMSARRPSWQALIGAIEDTRVEELSVAFSSALIAKWL
jgi:hypothetical protein